MTRASDRSTWLSPGYRDLGIEHITGELPTQPRDETLCRLDALHAEYVKLG